MIISKELNIGRAGEYIVLADLLLNGVQAYDTGQGVGYDVVADVNGKLIKIQVKTTKKMRLLSQRANPIYFFHIKRAGKNGNKFYTKTDFDCFALVALDKKLVFYLPFNEKIKSNSICIRGKEFDYSGNHGGGRRSALYYQNLTWENYTKNNL